MSTDQYGSEVVPLLCMISSLTWEPSKCGDGGSLDLLVERKRNAATAADGALSLAGETGREERAGDRRGVIREHEVEGAVGEGEVVRIRAADERRQVDEVDPCGVPGPRRAKRVDGVAGARGEAEDARRGREEAEAAERWEGGRGQGSGTASPARGGAQLSEAAVGRGHSARGGVAGGAREGGERDGERKGWDAGKQ
ncbi:unnamed protein product [Miscanthus lutarioriparius]|uniref:Uncharacterized protein n=1 Tax=Miscanthus lutarioriparius TaxID=422564 RepID=A0A811RWN5_9POAL|nr:unnamed protein product [Miscanthus lutarioriparius]